ncbi:hypothetical protein K1719_034211 [Acacia pycnantha]|nr:hypothetical protein K1719_034211 [Acacia pycnantha]
MRLSGHSRRSGCFVVQRVAEEGEYAEISLFTLRSVDELSVPESVTRDRRESSRLLGGLKGSLWSVVLAIGFALCAVMYSSGDLEVSLTPNDCP